MIIQDKLNIAPIPLVKKLLLSNSLSTGIFLLGISLTFGYLFRYVGNFMQDEGGNIAIGYLISKDQVLYRDIFTHHFPFTYYWIAVMLTLRRSLQIVRLSVLLFQLGVFATLMGLTRAYLAVGLTALTWSIIAPYYFGNQAIYSTFAGLSLLVVFAVSMIVLSQKRGLTRSETLAWGLFSAIALLANPLSIMPLGVSALALLFNAPSRAQLVWGTALILGILVGFLAYFGWVGALPSVFSNMIGFNINIYDRYLFHEEFSLLHPLSLLVKAALLGHNGWKQALVLMPFQDYPVFISALFGGTLYRIVIVVILVALLLNRKWLLGFFFYGFMAAVIFRTEEFYRQTPFILAILLSCAWLILGYFNTKWSPFQFSLPGSRPAFVTRFTRGLQVAAVMLTSASLFFLVGQSLAQRVTHRDDLAFTANFRNYYPQASDIQKLACGQDVKLGVYPADPLLYFYTDLEPVAGYVYFFPWVAEAGLAEVLASVQTEKTIILVDREASIWGISTKTYLADLLAYLDQHYVQVKGYYVSPELIHACDP